jgi:hypothetical protein
MSSGGWIQGTASCVTLLTSSLHFSSSTGLVTAAGRTRLTWLYCPADAVLHCAVYCCGHHQLLCRSLNSLFCTCSLLSIGAIGGLIDLPRTDFLSVGAKLLCPLLHCPVSQCSYIHTTFPFEMLLEFTALGLLTTMRYGAQRLLYSLGVRNVSRVVCVCAVTCVIVLSYYSPH